MGTQQLLLLVLSAIVVSLGIVLGINLTTSFARQENRNALMADLHHLANSARAHYTRPTVLGGGGHSFARFKVPPVFQTNANGKFEHTNQGHKADHIHFEATGKETGIDDANPIRIELRITIDEIKLNEIN